MVARALHGLPTGGASLHGHVAVGGVFLGNAHGAGVEVEVPLPEVCPCGHMSVAVEQLKSVSTYDGAEIFEGISEKGA